MLGAEESLDLEGLGARYRAGTLRPTQLIDGLLRRFERRGDDKVWIHRVAAEELMARAADLERGGSNGLPLYGIPFAIKDNIDLAGYPTTAACPDYRYLPMDSAPVVANLVAAGAIPVGKTNLDQFATGLVGIRSPYGVPGNSFNPAYVPGGSSSGSSIAVAAGLASFALGTDTAGSGRVPAAFNNLVGHKPTCGLLSARGVVPACRSLDCVSIFALTALSERVMPGTTLLIVLPEFVNRTGEPPPEEVPKSRAASSSWLTVWKERFRRWGSATSLPARPLRWLVRLSR